MQHFAFISNTDLEKKYKKVPKGQVITIASVPDLAKMLNLSVSGVKEFLLSTKVKVSLSHYQPPKRKNKLFDKEHFSYVLVLIEVVDECVNQAIKTREEALSFIFDVPQEPTDPSANWLIRFRLSYDSSHERGNCGFFERELGLDYLEIIKRLK